MQHEDEPCEPANLWRRLLADWLSEEGQVAAVAEVAEVAEVPDKAADERPRTSDEMAA
jgi:hypothetical protein